VSCCIFSVGLKCFSEISLFNFLIADQMSGLKTELLAFTEGKDKIVDDLTLYSNPIRKIHSVREINDKDQLVHVIICNFNIS